MLIQLNTDKNIEGDDKMQSYLNEMIPAALERFNDRITRIEVHLADENAGKAGADDKRCRLEARLSGKQPIAVTANANTVNDAINVAVDKIKTAIARELKLD